MIKDLQLKIVPRFEGAAAKKGITDHNKVLGEQKKILTDVDKQQSKVLKDAKRGHKEVAQEAEKAGHAVKRSFENALGGLEKLNKGFDSLKSKLINFKTVIAGSLIGGLAFEGISKALSAGQASLAAKNRIGREFGAEGAGIQALALKAARQAGLRDEDALKAIIPIAEAVQETQAGTKLRGKTLTAAQAARVRAQTIGFGSSLLTRIATVTGADPQEIGQLLAEAGTGDQGIRRFAGALGLNRVFSRQASAANEKGKLFELLGAERAKALGVAKGQVAGQGTLLDVILQQSGVTEAAATAKRKSFGFQKQAIGATLENVLGDLGEKALDKLTHGLGKGKTLAEKFQEAISSPKGKEAIEKIATGIERVVEGVLKLAQRVPEIIGFVEQHKTALMILGGGALAVRGAGSVAGFLGIGKGGVVDKIVGGDGSRVFVTNWPGSIGGTSAAGGPLGQAAKGILAGGLSTGATIALGTAAGAVASLAALTAATAPLNANMPQIRNETEAQLTNARDQRIRNIVEARRRTAGKGDTAFLRELGPTLAGQIGMDKGLQGVVQSVQNENMDPSLSAHDRSVLQGAAKDASINITLQLDGQTVAKVVAPHIARQISNRTANGTAPASRP